MIFMIFEKVHTSVRMIERSHKKIYGIDLQLKNHSDESKHSLTSLNYFSSWSKLHKTFHSTDIAGNCTQISNWHEKYAEH